MQYYTSTADCFHPYVSRSAGCGGEQGRQGRQGRAEMRLLCGVAGRMSEIAICGALIAGPDLWRGTTTPPVEVPHRSSTSHRFANMRPSGTAVIVQSHQILLCPFSHLVATWHSAVFPRPTIPGGWMLKQQWKGVQRGRIVNNRETNVTLSSSNLFFSLL